MQRLELQSATELMHLYQAAMAGKFEGRDKSLLLSEPLAQALERLVESIIASARATHNEPMVDSMLDGLVLTEAYPQYQLIIEAFSAHHEALNWQALTEETQLAYLKTAVKPLNANPALLSTMAEAIHTQINTND